VREIECTSPSGEKLDESERPVPPAPTSPPTSISPVGGVNVFSLARRLVSHTRFLINGL
jgi:hypothetical protein